VPVPTEGTVVPDAGTVDCVGATVPEGAVVGVVGVVGVVVLIVTEDARTADVGPVFDAASNTLLGAKRMITVPSVVHVAVTEKDVPEEVGTAKVQLAVPTFEKSALVSPLMASSKTTAYTSVRELAGEAGDEIVAVGATTSAVELFVTARFENEAASLPARSCTAEFDVAEFDAGATYATVTFTFGAITEGKVNVTVDPFTTTDVGVTFTKLAVTVKALAGAVVACNASLKVNITVLPFALTAPDARVGAVMSTPALLWNGYPLLMFGSIDQTADP
jgi:hypothetical protein